MPTTNDTIAAGELNRLELTPEMLGDSPQAEDKPVEAADKIRIQNMVDIEQFVYVDGKKWPLAPFQTAYLPKKVANSFMRERTQFVRNYARDPGYIEQGEPIAWLANTTGSPFWADEIEREVVRKGRVEYEKITNPLKRPRHLKWSLHVGQKTIDVDTGDGTEKKSLNFPPKVFEIAPFERKPFAAKYADRALQREGFCELHEQGKIVPCRAPEPGEPNGTWSYEELRLYAEMIDASTFEPMLKSKFKVPGPKAKPEHVEEMKAELLTYLFFRLIDSRFPLVPYEVFEKERAARGIAASE